MTPCTCNTDMGDTCPKCAPKPAVVPPKVGDRWGDLTPEQRAMVPVGTELGATRSGAYLLDTDYWITKHADGWYHPSPNFPRPSLDSNVAADRRITRLGPAPTATPEPDRSGWPVLVRSRAMAGYYHTNGMLAIEPHYGVFRAWPATWGTLPVHPIGKFDTALDAAEALGARLPDEVSEAEAADIERDAAAGAIAAIVRLGHTEHCARRLAWGDGECECGASEPNRALHPATSALLGTLAGLDEDDVLREIYNLERDSDADLDMAVYAWLDAGSPDAGNDILFGEVPTDPRDAEIADLRAKVEAAEAELTTLRDHANADPQDDRLLDHGFALLDLAAEKNPTLQHIAAILRVGVGR